MEPYTKVFLGRLVAYIVYVFGVSTIFMAIEKGEKSENSLSKTKGIYYYLKANDLFNNLTEKDFVGLVLNAAKDIEKPKEPWSYQHCYNFGIHLVTTIGKSF